MTSPTKQASVSEAMNPPRPSRRENIAHGFTQSVAITKERNSRFRFDLGMLTLALAGYYTWVPEERALLTTTSNLILVIIVLAA